MKSIKKFSAISVKDQSITESAKVTKEAVDELIKKIGFNSIDELKKEKDLFLFFLFFLFWQFLII